MKEIQGDPTIDEIITQHAIFKILDNDIIPCSCGGYRKIVQRRSPELLETQCSKCKSQESFNISDLAIIGGALLKLAFAKGNSTELKPLEVSYQQIFQMIEDIQNHELWTREIENQTFRNSLKILKGGISKT